MAITHTTTHYRTTKRNDNTTLWTVLTIIVVAIAAYAGYAAYYAPDMYVARPGIPAATSTTVVTD